MGRKNLEDAWLSLFIEGMRKAPDNLTERNKTEWAASFADDKVRYFLVRFE